MVSKALIFGAFVLAACVWLTPAYPLHASCKLTWKFSVNCTFVHNAIKKQMMTWSNDPGDCGTGEKCLYTVTSDSSDTLKGIHETPKKHYKDDLTMTFSDSCSVAGYSTSEVWYAYLDFGTNYCNLHNLVVGAGLNVATYGFKETTSDSDCTQYTSADCAKY